MKKILFICFSLWGLSLSAQTADSLQQLLGIDSYERNKWMLFDQDSIQIDSLNLQANSLKIKQNGVLLSDSCWSINGRYLYWNSNCERPKDSLKLSYKVLPFALQQPLFRKNLSLLTEEVQIGEDVVIGKGYSYNPYGQDEELADFKGLEYTGSFARGVSVGNRQDLVLNSSFNLQVNGKVGDVEITGALSDNNIPLQPEGNTQQLQDFDRIYLKFKVKKSYLIAGDYDLKKPEGNYFLNYYRRLQGGQIGTGFKLKNDAEVNTDMSFAISRGSFTRNVFLGEEGNQGPYRLRGAKGEVFLIILAGTERVFIDGVLMKRGADEDYVIDYNLGEITFTNKQLITKDKRIQIEFSYTDLNYLRTIYTFNTSYEKEKSRIRFSWYSEQDAKNQPAQANLSDSAKAVLRRVGDEIDQAFIWGASIPEEEEGLVGLVRYKLIDTLVNGVLYDSVLVYSTNLDSAIYTARFSAIEGGGNYSRVNDATNGTIYQWIPPDPLTGLPRGTHEPLELLATPKKKQMLNLGYDYKIGKEGQLSADFALSNNDQNTFSSVGNNDNQGLAARLTYQQRVLLRADSSLVDSVYRKRQTHLLVDGHYEFLQDRFEVIEPYRPREFQRDWNTDFTEKTAEHLARAGLSLQGSQWGQMRYEVSALLKDSLYQGVKQAVFTDVGVGGWRFFSQSSYLLANSQTERSRFLRPRGDLSYTFKSLNNFKVGVYYEQEQNRRLAVDSDSLLSTSFDYNVLKAYVEFPAKEQLNLKASALRRFDYSPLGKRFETLTTADELNFAGDWQVGRSSKLLWNLNYRNLRIDDSTRTTLDPKETYLGRVEYNLNLGKGFMRLNTVYELGAGQQQKVAYNYLEVDVGQGTHIWIDRNEDGVQQQNEFEQAVFQDQADFVRVTVLTGEFIRSNNVVFSQSLDLNPKTFFRGKRKDSPWAFVGNLSSRSLFKIERKTLPTTEIQTFNPFQLDVADTSLVSVGSNIRNVLYWNRSSPKFRVELQQSDARTKALLNIGFDSRRRTDYRLLPSWKIGQQFRGQLEARYGEQANTSEFFPERDYLLEFYEFKPQLTYMLKTTFRALLRYRFKDSRNQINDMETAVLHDITAEAKYYRTKGSNTNIRASFSWVNLAFDGQNNTPVQFAMTEGLQNGQNFLWTINFDRSLSKNIQLTLSYEGRKTGEAAVVHVGRAQVRALF
jgi:opacity protein-like surface antigen